MMVNDDGKKQDAFESNKLELELKTEDVSMDGGDDEV